MAIKLNQADLANVRLVLSGVKNGAEKVITRSINKTLTGVASTTKKQIAVHYNLTQKKIGENLKTFKASFSNLSGSVQSKGKPLSLTSFGGTRQVLKGVNVKVLKEKPKTLLKHAFVQTAKNSSQVFWRKREGFASGIPSRKGFPYGRLPKKYRYPMIRLTGPRVEDEFAKPRTIDAVTKYGGDRIVVVMEQELSFELSKL